MVFKFFHKAFNLSEGPLFIQTGISSGYIYILRYYVTMSRFLKPKLFKKPVSPYEQSYKATFI